MPSKRIAVSLTEAQLDALIRAAGYTEDLVEDGYTEDWRAPRVQALRNGRYALMDARDAVGST